MEVSQRQKAVLSRLCTASAMAAGESAALRTARDNLQETKSALAQRLQMAERHLAAEMRYTLRGEEHKSPHWEAAAAEVDRLKSEVARVNAELESIHDRQLSVVERLCALRDPAVSVSEHVGQSFTALGVPHPEGYTSGGRRAVEVI